MADLSVALEVDERTDRILDRDPVIDRMRLVKLDTIEPQSSQAVRTGAAQMLGPTIGEPTVGTGSGKPALRRHHQP